MSMKPARVVSACAVVPVCSSFSRAAVSFESEVSAEQPVARARVERTVPRAASFVNERNMGGAFFPSGRPTFVGGGKEGSSTARTKLRRARAHGSHAFGAREAACIGCIAIQRGRDIRVHPR